LQSKHAVELDEGLQLNFLQLHRGFWHFPGNDDDDGGVVAVVRLRVSLRIRLGGGGGEARGGGGGGEMYPDDFLVDLRTTSADDDEDDDGGVVAVVRLRLSLRLGGRGGGARGGGGGERSMMMLVHDKQFHCDSVANASFSLDRIGLLAEGSRRKQKNRRRRRADRKHIYRYDDRGSICIAHLALAHLLPEPAVKVEKARARVHVQR
jgi:hypothetical protein